MSKKRRTEILECFVKYHTNKRLAECLTEDVIEREVNGAYIKEKKPSIDCLHKKYKKMCIVAEKTQDHFMFDDDESAMIKDLMERGMNNTRYSVERGYSLSATYRILNKIIRVAELWADSLKLFKE